MLEATTVAAEAPRWQAETQIAVAGCSSPRGVRCMLIMTFTRGLLFSKHVQKEVKKKTNTKSRCIAGWSWQSPAAVSLLAHRSPVMGQQ